MAEEQPQVSTAEARPPQEIEVGGETRIAEEVVGAIAGAAARGVEGVSSLGTSSIRRTVAERLGGGEGESQGVNVEVGSKEAILDIDLRVLYGSSIPQVVTELRKKAAEKVVELCGLVPREINVHVVGVDFPESGERRVE